MLEARREPNRRRLVARQAVGSRGEAFVVAQFALLGAAGVLGAAKIRERGVAGWGSATAAAGAAVMVAGAGLVATGATALGSALTPWPKPKPGTILREHGPYCRIRHPIYTGLVLGTAGWGLTSASAAVVVLAAALAAVLDGKARREEGRLVAAVPGYARYMNRTRRFLPGIY